VQADVSAAVPPAPACRRRSQIANIVKPSSATTSSRRNAIHATVLESSTT
jgi:hypothetical protein